MRAIVRNVSIALMHVADGLAGLVFAAGAICGGAFGLFTAGFWVGLSKMRANAVKVTMPAESPRG
jgi:hypothetical protein